MSSLKVVVLDDYQHAAARFGRWDELPLPIVLDAVPHHLADPTEVITRLRGAAVVVAMRERTALDDRIFASLPDLRLVVTTGPSNAVIDVAAAHRRGIVVCGTGGYVTPTSELTWGLILAVARSIPAEDRAVRSGGWQHTMGVELAGRTLGLVGLGRIGSLVAKVGLAFGMHVQAWSENLDTGRAQGQGVHPVGREELFATSDVVSVHMVLSERTRGLVGARELELMKPSAILVNTSRGPIVDETALLEALASGAILGAGLDVFDREPLPTDHPLRSAPNVVLTPHLGYVTDGLYQLFYDEVVDDIRAWIEGTPVRQVTVS